MASETEIGSVRFIRALQISDSFFPVGAFAYSDGLETAVSGGRVQDGAALKVWMDHFIDQIFVSCEGLALVKGMSALAAGNLDAFYRIDEELSAIRPASAVRASSASVGKRLLAMYGSAIKNQSALLCSVALPCSNAAIVYALVFFDSGIDDRYAALAFGYNRLAGIVSAGLRLISMGQQQGQLLLTQALERLPSAVDRILAAKDEPITSFSPLLDIEQMNHQYVYSRLFRS
jgi:urease accessory protein